MKIDAFETSAIHHITDRSLWDDPMAAPSLFSDAPVPQPLKNIDVIRANQRKIVPFIEGLRKAAAQIVGSVHPEEVARLEQCLSLAIFYRMPDHPNWASQFSMQISDYPIFVETTDQSPSPLSDLLFPVMPIAEVKDNDDLITTDIQLNTLHTPLQWSGVGAQRKQRFGRVIFPGLCQTLEWWIKKIDGPIWNVRFSATPAEKIEDSLRPASFRHAVFHKQLLN